MATIQDVARRAGVSVGTVSNVLNRPSYVSPDIRARVATAIEALDFVPTATRRQFRTGRQRVLGLAIADMGNPFFVDIALGAESAAKRAGVGVLVVHNSEDPEREQQNLDLLAQQRVHGIMIAPVDERNPRLEQIVDRGIPVVYVDRISGQRPCCWVACDDVQGGRLAAEHLLARGHRRLGFVGDDAISEKVALRARGFHEFLGDQRCEISVQRIVAGSWDIEHGRSAGRLICALRTDERPTAVFCANDLLALGILQEVVHSGLRVPADLSIIGFDDIDWSAATTIPLTTVQQPRRRTGEIAAQMLLDEITEQDRHIHRHVQMTPELIVRESTGTVSPPNSN